MPTPNIYIYIYIGKSTKYQYINIWLISKKKKKTPV